jgi:hypothetical protein
MTVEDALRDTFWAMLKTQAALQVEVSRLQALVPKDAPPTDEPEDR